MLVGLGLGVQVGAECTPKEHAAVQSRQGIKKDGAGILAGVHCDLVGIKPRVPHPALIFKMFNRTYFLEKRLPAIKQK